MFYSIVELSQYFADYFFQFTLNDVFIFEKSELCYLVLVLRSKALQK